MVFIALSMWYKALKPTRFWVIIGFMLLVLNAWLGSIVVATNLLPGIVSLHFLLSFLCLFAFILSIHKVSPILSFHDQGSNNTWKLLFWVIFVEVILGTWSREQVDALKGTSQLYLDGNSNGMLNFIGMDWLFMVHRFVPGAILIYSFREYWKFRNLIVQNSSNSSIFFNFTSHWLIIFVVSFLQICLGAIHIVYVVPAWTQIAHVVLGSALLTYSFTVYLSYKKIHS